MVFKIFSRGSQEFHGQKVENFHGRHFFFHEKKNTGVWSCVQWYSVEWCGVALISVRVWPGVLFLDIMSCYTALYDIVWYSLV